MSTSLLLALCLAIPALASINNVAEANKLQADAKLFADGQYTLTNAGSGRKISYVKNSGGHNVWPDSSSSSYVRFQVSFR